MPKQTALSHSMYQREDSKKARPQHPEGKLPDLTSFCHLPGFYQLKELSPVEFRLLLQASTCLGLSSGCWKPLQASDLEFLTFTLFLA